MTYFLFVIKILILAFTLYNFFKNRGAKKPDEKRKEPDIVLEDIPQIKSYKKLLGIKNNFDSASLKQAYRRMAKINHPDLFKTPKDKAKATQKMLKINEAYKVLSEYLQYRECFLQI